VVVGVPGLARGRQQPTAQPIRPRRGKSFCRATGRLPPMTAATRPSAPFQRKGRVSPTILICFQLTRIWSQFCNSVNRLRPRSEGDWRALLFPGHTRRRRLPPVRRFPQAPQKLANVQISCCNPCHNRNSADRLCVSRLGKFSRHPESPLVARHADCVARLLYV
jgi:hypothetical protein